MKNAFEICLLFFFFGGHVAYGMARNDTVLPDPHLSSIGSRGTGKSNTSYGIGMSYFIVSFFKQKNSSFAFC